MYYAFLAAACWVYFMAGLAVHCWDIRHRHQRGQVGLASYDVIRPIDWVLSGLVLVAGLQLLVAIAGVWDVHGADVRGNGQYAAVAIAAAVCGVMVYYGVVGVEDLHQERKAFPTRKGSTQSSERGVVVNISIEALSEARRVRRAAWPLHLGLSAIMVVCALLCGQPMLLVPVALICAAGAALVVIGCLGLLPMGEEDREW